MEGKRGGLRGRGETEGCREEGEEERREGEKGEGRRKRGKLTREDSWHQPWIY